MICEILQNKFILWEWSIWWILGWGFEFYLSGSDSTTIYIVLGVGSQVWNIKGNHNDLRWLLSELSYYLYVEPTKVTLPINEGGGGGA